MRALAGATGPDADAAQFILTNLPQRLAESLRGEIETAGQIRPRDAEEAMTEVVASIRLLVSSGDLSFIPPSDDDQQAA